MTHARRLIAAALLLALLGPPASAQIVGPFGNTWFGRPTYGQPVQQAAPPICYGPQCEQAGQPVQYGQPQYSPPPQVRYAGPGEFQAVDPTAPGAAAGPSHAGPSAAAPQAPPAALALPQTLTRSIARLRASKPIRDANGEGIGSDLGTGTLIGPTLVLTCGHILREQPTTLSVEWPDGTVAPARLIASDMGLDVSLWEIAPTSRPPVTIATVDPAPRDPVIWLGYGGETQLAGSATTARGYVNNGQWLEIAAPVRQGDSGGPILNDRLELVATIQGTGGGVTDGPCCKFIRHFLARHNRLPAAPAQPRNNTPATPPASGPPIAETRPSLPPIAAAEPPPPAATAPEPDPRLPQLEAEADQLRGQLAGERTAADGLKAKLAEARDKAAAAAQAAADRLRAVEEKAAAALANAAAEAAKLKDLATHRDAAEPSGVPSVVTGALDKAATWGLTEILIGAGLGAWPAGLIAAGAWWIAKRRGKKKVAALRDKIAAKTADPPAASDDAAAAPEQAGPLLLRRNRYVPYETNIVDKAWADSVALLVEKYPGWKAPLEAAEDLKDQILAGVPRKTLEER